MVQSRTMFITSSGCDLEEFSNMVNCIGHFQYILRWLIGQCTILSYSVPELNSYCTV